MTTRRFAIETTLLLIAVCLVGCAKKAPKQAAPPTETIRGESAPHAEPGAEPAPKVPLAQGDPLAGPLDAVNVYVHEQGLLGDVFFELDRSEVRPEDVSRLRRNAAFIREHPEFQFTVEGHCDERDTVEYNLALGDRRAQSTQRYLLDLGVEQGRTDTISYGRERPVCKEPNEDCWQRNRRAHFVITASRQIAELPAAGE